MQRGTLNAGKTGITAGTSTFAECWGLDTTGNWSNYRQDDDGDGSWGLIQNRANNTVNEITNITESTGPSWITPAYDAAGNMTIIPKPANPTIGYTGIYDAWNRLVAIKEGGDFVAEYAYDPAKRRTIQKAYSSGVLSETRHLYYTEPSKWQVIEERVGSSTDAERQFVWGLRYIDDLVLRDRDTDANGSLDERLYAMQDGNWNVTAITNASGTVQERYAYAAYGSPIFLDASFGARGASSYAWETLYSGYRWEAASSSFQVRNRIYLPIISWIQRDQLIYSGGSSLYLYCFSQPVTLTDPTGMVPGCPDCPVPWTSPQPWQYGCYCGKEPNPPRKKIPPPIDPTDICCQSHDSCCEKAKTAPDPVAARTACNADLCKCAKKAQGQDCPEKGVNQKCCCKAAAQILTWYCDGKDNWC
jgi:RHS repeat-associated protein